VLEMRVTLDDGVLADTLSVHVGVPSVIGSADGLALRIRAPLAPDGRSR
jgi:hypothetical protein